VNCRHVSLKRKRCEQRKGRLDGTHTALVTILSTVMMAAPSRPLRREIEEARQLVEKSKLTFENFAADVNLGDLPDLLKRRRAS